MQLEMNIDISNHKIIKGDVVYNDVVFSTIRYG